MDSFEGFLKQILSLFHTARHSRQIAQQTISVPAYKLAEGRRIALNMGVDQAFVRFHHRGH
jgi:hypothetical protein